MKPYDEFSCSDGSSGMVLPDGKILYYSQCSERHWSTNARLTKRALDGLRRWWAGILRWHSHWFAVLRGISRRAAGRAHGEHRVRHLLQHVLRVAAAVAQVGVDGHG